MIKNSAVKKQKIKKESSGEPGSGSRTTSNSARIKERKQAQELRESEERYRTLVELSPDTIAVQSAGKFVYINPAGVRLFGANSPEDIIGKNVLDLVHPDYHAFVASKLKKLEKETGKTSLRELKLLRLDGHSINIESSATAILYMGRPAAQIIIRDVSDRKVAEQKIDELNHILSRKVSEQEKAEEALRESEERLRLATNAANEAIWDWDLVEDSVKWNNTYTILFGRTGNSGCSPAWWIDRIHPEDRDRILTSLNDAKKSAESWTGQYRFKTPASGWAYVYDRAFIARDKNGNARRIIGALLDITDQKIARDELQKSHEQLEKMIRERTDELSKAYELLKRIFASITVHIAYMDREFNYISVNRAYAEAEGRSPDFFAGKNYFDLYPDEENKAIFTNVVRTGEPYSFYGKPFVSTNPELGMTYWDWSVQPVKDIENSVSGLLLSSVDVTDRKRAEENNIRLAAAIESAADGVIISDVRGIIQYVNPAFEKITGYSRQEALGLDLHILDGHKYDDAFYSELRDTLRRDGFWKGYLINKKKDGSFYNEECTYSPIKNASGETINHVSIKRDVTEKLRLESIAQSVDTINNIGYVFAGVRHEIGNPVNAANMILEVLKSKLAHLERAAIEDYLDRALGQLSRVEYLLRSLKNYNMYEKPHLQRIEMNNFMNEFLSFVREDFKMKGIAVNAVVLPEAEFCYADPRALHQILLNLLTNASDALQGKESRTIDISVFKKDGMVRIQVQDNGCGMSEQEQKALFKPFYTTKAKGTGLGLVIAKKMLTMMKGTIEVASRKNTGTAVIIGILNGSPKGGMPDNSVSGEVGLNERRE